MLKQFRKFGLAALAVSALALTSCEDDNNEEFEFLDLQLGGEDNRLADLIGTFSSDDDEQVIDLITFLDLNDIIDFEFTGDEDEDADFPFLGFLNLDAIVDGTGLLKFNDDGLAYELIYDVDGGFKINLDLIDGLLEDSFVEIIIDGDYDVIGALGDNDEQKPFDVFMIPTAITVKYQLKGLGGEETKLLNEQGTVVTVVGLDKDRLILDNDIVNDSRENEDGDNDGLLGFLLDDSFEIFSRN